MRKYISLLIAFEEKKKSNEILFISFILDVTNDVSLYSHVYLFKLLNF